MTKIFTILAVFILPFYSNGQTLSPTQVKDDLNMLVEGIKTYNPALPFYCPDFEKETNQVIESINDSLTMIEYFQKVSRICAHGNEGHFGLGGWNDTVHKGFLNDEYKYLPISVKIVGGEIYAWKDYSNENELTKGDKIISINDISSSQILSNLYNYIPSDGSIQTYANHTIEAGFAWMYYLYIDQSDKYKIMYASPRSKSSRMMMTALTKSKQSENYKAYFPSDTSKTDIVDGFFTLEYDKGTALLTLPSFDYKLVEEYNVKASFLYKSIFTQIADSGATSLVIDLRFNTGGRNEFADEMVPYILKTDNGNSFMKRSTSWDGKEKTHKLPNPSKLKFKGPIYVLVNGKTYSAGSTLARYLKEYGKAIIIGEETGSRYEGFAAGSSQKLTLPHSQINIYIPRYHTRFPLPMKQETSDRGVLPHYRIIRTIEDCIGNSDVEMERAKTLINK